MFLELVSPTMGTNFDPAYACLSVGYLEETILFPRLFHFPYILY